MFQCCTPLDLRKNRQVDTREAREYAESIGALFAETSALTAENVLPLFEAISEWNSECTLLFENK